MPAVCFDAACQAASDRAALWSYALPAAAAAAAMWRVWAGRTEPAEVMQELKEAEALAEDKRGDVILTPWGYTPWPVDKDADPESFVTLRVPLGVAGRPGRLPQPFAFPHTLGESSQIYQVTLERPMGITFEERRGRAEVVELTPGGNAEQMAKVARMQPGGAEAADAPMEGDVLRACTCTTFAYKNMYAQGFGERPRRIISIFGGDSESYERVINALRRGLVADGPVTLIFERRRRADRRVEATATAETNTS